MKTKVIVQTSKGCEGYSFNEEFKSRIEENSYIASDGENTIIVPLEGEIHIHEEKKRELKDDLMEKTKENALIIQKAMKDSEWFMPHCTVEITEEEVKIKQTTIKL